MNEKIFPTIMIVLQCLAAGVYFASKDIRHGIYWISAAVLTTVVTY